MATQAARFSWEDAVLTGIVIEKPATIEPAAPILAAPGSPPALRTGYGYAPSKKPRLVAAGAAAALTLLIAAPLAFLHGEHGEHHRRHLAVFNLKEFRLPPPPQPHEAKAEQPRHLSIQPVSQPRPQPPVVVPAAAPVVTLPAAPTVIAAPAPPAPAAAAPAVKPAAAMAKGDDLNSRIIDAPPPAYPEDSRRLHEQGTVVLLVMLGEDGRVEDVTVKQSSGSFRLDHAALKALHRWRWAPTLVNGAAVKVSGLVKIPFILKA